MSEQPRSGSLPFFFVKFVVFAAVLAYLWWEFVMTKYGVLLVKILEPCLDAATGLKITGHIVGDPRSLFNTGTVLTWVYEGIPDGKLPPYMNLAELVTNLVPFVALTLATAGLGFVRRIGVLLAGCAILMATHVAFLYIAFVYRDTIPSYAEMAQVVSLFLLTLPFLLWIVLAYWGKTSAPAAGSPEQAQQTQFSVSGARLLPDEDDDNPDLKKL